MIRVFIGTEPAQRLACELLKYSLRAHSLAEFEFIEITGSSPDLPMQTGFSFCRWQIPELCKYHGRAIYMDADIAVIDDIRKVWDPEMSLPALARPTADKRFYTSVMVLDCAELTHWKYQELLSRVRMRPTHYAGIMWASLVSPYHHDFGDLPGHWNEMDQLKQRTSAVHYTDLQRQPWRFAGHPVGLLWHTLLRSAVRENAIPEALVREEIAKGHVRHDVLSIP